MPAYSKPCGAAMLDEAALTDATMIVELHLGQERIAAMRDELLSTPPGRRAHSLKLHCKSVFFELLGAGYAPDTAAAGRLALVALIGPEIAMTR
jgi:hypothetical protein